MRIKMFRYLSLAVCMLVCSVPLAFGAEPEKNSSQEPVQLEAEELVFDQASGTYLAEREVVLRQGGQELKADRVRWKDETSEAEAFGDVHFSGPDGELFGDEMFLNLASGQGQVANGRILVHDPKFHISGTTIAKTGERSYRVEEGTFTSCDGPVPSWKFTASDLDVTMGGYAWAKNVKFHIYDVPVLYLPIIGYPVKTERESGLLIPSVGYSDSRGSQLFMSYYQVIDRNQDATFYLDYLSRLGLGKGLEYRYIFGHDNRGALKGYHVNGFSGHDDSFAFDWLHRGTLPGRVRLTADVEYVDNREFFSDFGEAAEEYNKDKVETVVAANRHWGKNNLTGQVKYTKDLEQSNDETLQRLPELQFALLKRRLWGSPFYFDLDTSAVHLWREEGLKGARLSMRPALTGVFRLGGVVDVTSELGYRERLYTSTQGEERHGLFDFSTRLSSRLARAYAVDVKSVDKIQHVMQPEVLYQYRPFQDQSDLPQFEAEDYLYGRNTISYGLINRLIARSEAASGEVDYREFLYFRLAQEFDVEESMRHPLAPQGQGRPFSDLRAEFILRPTRWNYFDIDTRYDISGPDNFLTFHAETGLVDQKGNALSLRYRYNRDVQEYLATKLELSLLKPIYLSFENRRELQGGANLENVLNLEYRAQCWSLYLTCRDRDGDQEVTINFALAGLDFTSHPGSRRKPL
ncbi:LPS-assembly protein LptD [Syntrophotalea acetylenivorans]|nr:LPS assembly protein LptD [Syntrophotalea acetylenivorans]